ncbi:MAG: hypothetical protein PVH88_15880 [Ignavibacteria bacterium]|jgi:hypothetical protein
MKPILLFFLFNIALFGQRADFFKEDITFRLDGVHLNVEGYYWFANNSNKEVGSNIFYPFPDSVDEKIDSIHIFNLSKGYRPEYTSDRNNGITFNLFIEPGDTVLFQIGYRQKLNSDSALYILKTTQTWGKPLKHAEYKLIVPDSLEIKNFSYLPDKTYTINDLKIYYWEKINFMPKKDMIFHFPNNAEIRQKNFTGY